MRNTLRALAVMVEVSLRADAPRSAGALLTASLSMASLPLRAIGLRTLTDGILAASMADALNGAALIVALTGVNRLMFWISMTVRMRMRENTEVYVDAHMMDLTAGIPGLEHHERPDYQDRVELTRADRWALVNPFNPLSWTIGSVVQLASVTALFGTVHPVLLLLPLAGVPSVLATMRAQRQWLRLRESQAESNRVLRHLQDLSTQSSAAKEIRIFGLTDELLRRRRALFFDLEHARLRQSIRATSLTTLAWLFFSACFVAALAFTVDLVQRGEATVGSVVLVLGLGASINLQLAILAWNASWLIRTHGSVVNLLWLRDYADDARRAARPERPMPTPITLREGIRFQNVSFHYAGVERRVLDHVDLFLPAGSTVAIVGENGAGKTTLVKLLTRFYEPTSGAILLDGQDLARFPVNEWRQRLAAGFQDFARLQLLARESIGVGDLEQMAHDEPILAALTRAAAHDLPSTLPSALETQLGREFQGGVDLSLGQWQKVALGRAMMRERVLLLLLDEPTASLDAPTEHALFEHFAQAARDYAHAAGAITILVSHRFSTVRMADLIVVIDNGRIIERGTHAELLRHDGLYAELYRLQASAYR
jgi:ATP-binding cassette, subfamily B, bacterial